MGNWYVPPQAGCTCTLFTGRIVADGTHDELIETSDVYKRLYETRLLGTS